MKYSIKYLTVVLIILMTLTQCKKENMKSDRCNLVPDAGSCNAAFPKYYFDKNEKKCKVFIWASGTDGRPSRGGPSTAGS